MNHFQHLLRVYPRPRVLRDLRRRASVRILARPAALVCIRNASTQGRPVGQADAVDVSHSHFIAEASPSAEWRSSETQKTESSQSNLAGGDDFDRTVPGRGKLSPTTTHLFKLILPLDVFTVSNYTLKTEGQADDGGTSSTIFLLHPSQPLSHVSTLILASLPQNLGQNINSTSISFRCTSPSGQRYQWSHSTDIGDFVRDAALAAHFDICIRLPSNSSAESSTPTILCQSVDVPSFADRTRFLRRRLASVGARLAAMEALKTACDKEAHRGARRMAVGGFGLLVVYWAGVARLTFVDYGWDVMEPITYLSGLSTVLCGYFWFLYQGREVSYTSVLDQSVSTRRTALYKERGLDIERWVELRAEQRALKQDISRIREDYGEESDDDESGKNEADGDTGDGSAEDTLRLEQVSEEGEGRVKDEPGADGTREGAR